MNENCLSSVDRRCCLHAIIDRKPRHRHKHLVSISLLHGAFIFKKGDRRKKSVVVVTVKWNSRWNTNFHPCRKRKRRKLSSSSIGTIRYCLLRSWIVVRSTASRSYLNMWVNRTAIRMYRRVRLVALTAWRRAISWDGHVVELKNWMLLTIDS